MLFKIGEFSKITQISVRMLRHYDEIGLLHPVLVDQQSGYRYYDASQINQVQKIIFLRDIGFKASDIITLLPNWGQDDFKKVLQQRHLEIQGSIVAEQGRLMQVERAITEADNFGEIHYNYMIKSIPEAQVISLRRIIPSYFDEGYLWKELYQYMSANSIEPIANELNLAIYHDEDYREHNVDVEVCAFVTNGGNDEAGFSFRTIAAIPYVASTMIHGPFENIAGGFLAFAGWLEQHPSYQMGKISRQIVHRGPWNETEPEKYLTEIQIPVYKR